MSVVVTTSFSQGAVFYAGETVSCTITFTHSSSKANKNQHDLYYSRNNSLSNFDLNSSAFSNRAQPNNIARSRQTSEVESLALGKAPSRKMSLSSLASSTFSYFTGTSSYTNTKEPEYLADQKDWKSLYLNDIPSKTHIDVADEDNTPRSSMDTQSQYTESRRSSIESNLSRQTRSPFHRFSVTSLHRSLPSLQHYSEHLLWGSAQIIGQFIPDPVLIKSNVFTPLKTQAMYHPSGTAAGGGTLTTSQKRESRSIPVFSTPPSILFVDLTLAPGESVQYSYKLKLPENLPPTYRGKSMRFNYYLVIGSQRSSSTQQQGHVVQIPFRVFNHVSENGVRPIYDLMHPEVHFRDQAIIDKVDMDKKKEPDYYPSSRRKNIKPNEVDTKARQNFKDYIDRLLEKTAFDEPVHKIMQRENDLYDDKQENATLDVNKSCCQVISRITNAYKKATFEICKSNKRVAHLYLTKTLFRLGEPIQGIVDFEGAAIPTFQISVYLESNEIVEDSIASRQPSYIAKVSRKKHAGYHAFCKNDKRLTFSLAVPTSESPEFQTSAMKLQYYIRLDFITAENTSFDLETIKEHTNSTGYDRIQASNFDCQIPIHLFGSSSNGTSKVAGSHHFTIQ